MMDAARPQAGRAEHTRRMSAAAGERPDVVLDLLRELRAGAYLPPAWARFFLRSGRLSWATSRTHPHLTRSWALLATELVLAALGALAAEARLGGDEGARAARRALPGTVACLSYTLLDAYVHLGMNRRDRQAPLQESLGLPTSLSLTRGVAADLLWGHLLGGVPAAKPFMAGALAVAVATDIGDGAAARTLGRVTRLGTYLDSEVDLGLATSLALTLAARGLLPKWLVALTLLRWSVPLAFVLAGYFGGLRRVPLDTTRTGKAAGIAQTLTVGAALLPTTVAERMARVRRALHLVTAALLLAAPLAHGGKTLRARWRARRSAVLARGRP